MLLNYMLFMERLSKRLIGHVIFLSAAVNLQMSMGDCFRKGERVICVGGCDLIYMRL